MSKKYTDRQTEKITRTNEHIRVLRPKSRILKVPFPFPFLCPCLFPVPFPVPFPSYEVLPRTYDQAYEIRTTSNYR